MNEKTKFDLDEKRLTPRNTPVQKRGKKTVEKILDCTGELLESMGMDALTTNHVAEISGINIATLYRYFPNKHALLVALARRLATEQGDWVDAALREYNGSNFHALVDKVVDNLTVGMCGQRGGVAIRRAMQSHPELWEMDYNLKMRLTDEIADLIDRVGIGLPAERRKAIASIMVETYSSIFDLAYTWGDEHFNVYIDEIKILLHQYLDFYVAKISNVPREPFVKS